VEQVLVGAGGRFALSAGQDNSARLWVLPGDRGYASPPYLSRPRTHTQLGEAASRVAALEARAREHIAAGNYPGALRALTEAREVPGHERDARLLSAWRGLGRRLPRAGVRSAWLARTLTGHSMFLTSVDLSGDGTLAATASVDGTARIWDLSDGRCVATLVHEQPVSLARLSADGAHAVTFAEKVARRWEVGTGECTGTVQAAELGFAADAEIPAEILFRWLDRSTVRGSRAVRVGRDGMVRVWDVESGKNLLAFRHPDGAAAACLSADGHTLLTSCGAGADIIEVRDAESGELVRRFESRPGAVYQLAASPDGGFAVSGHRDEPVRVWDARTGTCLRSLGDMRGDPCLAFTPDGRYVLSGTNVERAARLWELDWELSLPAGP
jgi:WD40 repeat protein